MNSDESSAGETAAAAGQGTRIVLLALATALLVGLVLLGAGTGPDGIRAALRISARLSLVWFLLAYVAGPLERLRPGGLGAVLKRHRRVFGVVFGLSMTMHVGFILKLYSLYSPQRPPMVTDTDFSIGIPGLLLVAAMTVTSAARLRRSLGTANWTRLHRAGLHFVWAVFFLCLVDSSARKETAHFAAAYGLFLGALVAAAALRAAAWRRSRTTV